MDSLAKKEGVQEGVNVQEECLKVTFELFISFFQRKTFTFVIKIRAENANNPLSKGSTS